MYATVSNDVGLSTPPQGITRLDMRVEIGEKRTSGGNLGKQILKNGVQSWYPGQDQFTNEPLIIPRKRPGHAATGELIVGLPEYVPHDTAQ